MGFFRQEYWSGVPLPSPPIHTTIYIILLLLFVWSLSHLQLFEIPWTAACQTSLSLTISQSLLKLMSIESVMPSKHLISSVAPFTSCPQSFPAFRSILVSWFFIPGGQSMGALASASVFPMNIQSWFPLRWTGLISLLSKNLLYSTENPTHCSVMTYIGKGPKKEWIYVHVWLIHFAVRRNKHSIINQLYSNNIFLRKENWIKKTFGGWWKY